MFRGMAIKGVEGMNTGVTIGGGEKKKKKIVRRVFGRQEETRSFSPSPPPHLWKEAN